MTELSQHEADRSKAQERQAFAVETLLILCQASATVESGDGAFDDPSLGQDSKAFGHIGALDDLNVDLPENFANGRVTVTVHLITRSASLYMAPSRNMTGQRFLFPEIHVHYL